MNEALLFRTLGFVGSIIVGVTATIQLKNEWAAKGLDAIVTKLLLGLMALGCILVFFATLNILGARA
jgi:hypothetical protein